MSGVKGFFDELTAVQQDTFVSVVTDLQASAPQDKIKRLDDFHAQLKVEIDQINRRRQALGGMLNNVNTLMKHLEQHISRTGESLELVLFRSNLQKVVADLKAEVAALKPEKKLIKKFDVARRRESLVQRQDLAGSLFSDILGNATPDKGVVITLPKDTQSDDVLMEEDDTEE